MDILKRLKMRVYALFAVSLGVAILSGFGLVKAYQGIAPNILLESGAVLNYQEAVQPIPPVEEELGGGSVVPCENFNGIDVCSYAEGFNQGSTTLFAIKNPFSATSTVDFFTMEGKVGSTAVNFYVGTSTKSSIPIKVTTSVKNVDISASLVDAAEVGTSTKFYFVNGQNAVSGSGQVAAGGASLSSMVLGPNEYIVGYASGTHPNLGDNEFVDNSTTTTARASITGSANTFFGNYGLRIVRPQTPQKN